MYTHCLPAVFLTLLDDTTLDDLGIWGLLEFITLLLCETGLGNFIVPWVDDEQEDCAYDTHTAYLAFFNLFAFGYSQPMGLHCCG